MQEQRPEFDQLRALAAEDPEAFEAKRRELIEAALVRIPAERRQRMRALQWRVDQERQRAPNALAACLSLSRMMWDSVTRRDGLLDALHGRAKPRHGTSSATVIRLRQRH